MNQRLKILTLIVLATILILGVVALCSCDFLLGGNKAKLTVAYDNDYVFYENDSLDSLRPFLSVKYTDENGEAISITDYTLSGTLQKGISNVMAFFNGVSCVIKVNVSENVLKYTLNSDGESYSVSSMGDTTDAKIIIPSIYNDKPVTGIGNFAFGGCSNLTGVVIPDSITTLGLSVFLHCENLKNVTIGSGVSNLTPFVFERCTSLESIKVSAENANYYSSNNCIMKTSSKKLIFGCKNSVIPEDVTAIGEDAFSNCNITSIIIPNSVLSIEDTAFFDCSKLESVTIGDNVIRIGRQAFSNCISLKSIVIPDSVLIIDEMAFLKCENLKKITIGSGVISMGVLSFEPFSIESIEVSSSNEKYHSKNNCLIETESGSLLLGCKNSVIPTDGSVTKLTGLSFCGCSSLTSIDIPSSVTEIGGSVFSSCSNLSTVRFDGSVTEWKAIKKAVGWNEDIPATKVICSNGEVAL